MTDCSYLDPVAIQIGPLAIKWYALAYISGLVLGWLYLRWLIARPALWFSKPAGRLPIAEPGQVDDLLVWATLGVIGGGRLGHVLFYGLYQNADYYLDNPLRVFFVWEGGMSFHGGLLGVIIAVIWFCRRANLDLLRIGDGVALAAPIGLCFGRLANFVNGEIWGRVTDSSWGVVFPCAVPQGVPRHPSQLYEAALEGAALFALLFVLARFFRMLHRPGLGIGIFLLGYSAARLFVEIVYRDSNNKIEGSVLTIGELLTVPMVVVGLMFLWFAYRDRLSFLPGGAWLLKNFPVKDEAAPTRAPA
ncbi:MAG: prolipoprotein diacylglyceryl transferase [Alphaproteobacteria bacterium]|nr:prolipoprotein diacylglyceryl transferase [Alphaproteobacteria bacterium]